MSDTNKNCDFCDSCKSCDSCDSCYSCDSCDFCDSCKSCDSCYSCDSCNSCNSCDFCNSCKFCYFSKGLLMSEYMLFCVGKGKYESSGEGYQKNYRIFNNDVEKKEWERIKSTLPTIKVSMILWVDKNDMSSDEKDNYPVYKEIGGYLKRISYDDAWQAWWNAASEKDKKAILDIPQFDAVLFKEITSIDVQATPRMK